MSVRRQHRPLVERIAGWSASHAKTAVIGWFALVGVSFLAGQLLGTQSVPQYDPGQTGTAEQALHRLNITTPPSESVIIQARGPSAASRTFATDPHMRLAVRQVVAALSKLPSSAAEIRARALCPRGRDPGGTDPGGTAPASRTAASTAGLISADGRSALVTFQVPGPPSRTDTTVRPDLAAVARVQAANPGLLIAEGGSASASAAGDSLLESGFR